MKAAGVVLDTLQITIKIERFTGWGWYQPLVPLLEELADGVDPDAEHDGDDDELLHVGDV